jgi:excisionase family DNA binding protein
MDALLDINSVARLLSLSPWTVRRLIFDGRLTPVRLGRRVLVEPAEVARLVSQVRQAPNSHEAANPDASEGGPSV